MANDDLLPGLPLPTLDQVRERQLYHIILPDGQTGTVSRDEGIWR